MLGPKDLSRVRKAEEAWKKEFGNAPEQPLLFETLSSIPVQRTYTPSDLKDIDYLEDIGLPGQYPFTRGVHASGYRGKLWTMRMFAGFGTPQETNKRFK